MNLPQHIPKPKLCSLRKWETFTGYGFNLHSEKGKLGQFIGKVDPNSPAQHGGLLPNDFLIEVNGVNVEEASHNIAVGRVKSIPDRVDLFVCSQETQKYCKENGIKLSSEMQNIEEFSTPLRQPTPPPEVESADAHETQPSAGAGAAAASVTLRAAIERAGAAEFEEVKPEQLPERFRIPEQLQQPHPPGSPASARKRDSSPLSFAAPKAASVVPATSPPQQPQQQQPQQQPPQKVPSTAAAGKADPVGNVSLDDMRSRIGKNRRNQVKLTGSSFTEKYSMFESL